MGPESKCLETDQHSRLEVKLSHREYRHVIRKSASANKLSRFLLILKSVDVPVSASRADRNAASSC